MLWNPVVLPIACDDILGLEEALQKLEQTDARKAELVKLRFFAGLTVAQAAQALGISATTAENDWTYARCWLRLEMAGRENFLIFSKIRWGLGRWISHSNRRTKNQRPQKKVLP